MLNYTSAGPEQAAQPRSEATAPALARIAPLDGLRGIAILAVLVYHCFLLTDTHSGLRIDTALSKLTGAGWIGVDLFFVLSGFLITRILLDAKDGAHYFTSFYARRILRIFPVYYGFLIVLIVVLPAMPHFRGSLNLADLREHQGAYWTYTFNVVFARNPLDNWGTFSNGHLWSLMVEEQFYLVWPLAVLLLRPRNLALGCLACLVGAPIVRLALLHGYVPRLDNGFAPYMLLPARVDTLAAGALIAIVARDATLIARLRIPALFLLFGALAGLLVIFAGNDGFEPLADEWLQVLGFSAVAVACASVVLLAIAAPHGAALHRLGTQPTLTFFGRYSYAIYVFHYQITWTLSQHINVPLVAGSDVPGRIGFTFGILTLMAALGWLSWQVYEKQFLRLKRFFPYGRARSAPDPATTESVSGLEQAELFTS